MLNERKERELAYVVRVDSISAMDADRLECAHIGGWNCVVGKGEFKAGDLAVYFEIDSKLPEKEPFSSMEFLVSKHYAIKSQKIRGVISQGLLVSAEFLGWEPDWYTEADGTHYMIGINGHRLDDESRFVTKELEVTYAVAEDNVRKSSGVDKYKKMAQRNVKFAKTRWWKWLYKRRWGKKVLFFFFGRKRDVGHKWPSWVVKTDEERAQNCPYLFSNMAGSEWVATEKVDGSSTTFTMRGYGRKREFYVCSRNVVFDKPDQKCYYETNIYTEMAEKYKMEEVCANAMDFFKDTDTPLEFVTIQGETYGGNIQKRNYGEEHRLAVFNVIFGFKNGEVKRLNPIEMHEFLPKISSKDGCALSGVPIVDEHYVLPATCEEVLQFAGGKSQIDGGMREGVVFRSLDGAQSFKAVDNNFLLKYHG